MENKDTITEGEKIDRLARYTTAIARQRWGKFLMNLEDEVLSEAYVAATKAVRKYPGAKGRNAPWSWSEGMYAYGTLVAGLRNQQYLPPAKNPEKSIIRAFGQFDDRPDFQVSELCEKLQNVDVKDYINWLTESLTGFEKHVLTLYYYDDKSKDQIADYVGCTGEWVRLVLKAVTKKLRQREKIMK